MRTLLSHLTTIWTYMRIALRILLAPTGSNMRRQGSYCVHLWHFAPLEHNGMPIHLQTWKPSAFPVILYLIHFLPFWSFRTHFYSALSLSEIPWDQQK